MPGLLNQRGLMYEQDEHVVSIVDDDPSLRRSVRNLLTSMGFRVETFASAEQFLESALERTGCLVLDLRMEEGMQGLELLRHLTMTGNRIPAIILTAHGDDDLRERAEQDGAVAFLSKPFRADVLLEAVRSAMGSTT